MLTYIISIIFILLSKFIITNIKITPDKKNKIFTYTVATYLALLSGLRHISIGADTQSYKFIFNQLSYTRWLDLFAVFRNIPHIDYQGSEVGYLIFVKAIQVFTTNYQIFLLIIGFMFSLLLGRFILQNSKMPATSFLVYIATFFQFYGTTGIRQTVATTIAVLIGFEYIRKRKLIKFICLILLAILIHKSALFFLPFYFIGNKKISGNYIISMLGISGVIYIFRYPLINTIVNIVGYEEYAQQYEKAGTPVFTLMLLLLIIVTLVLYKTMLKDNPNSIFFINAILIALILTPFTYIDPSIMRVVMYYSFFIILLIPEIIGSFVSKNDQNLVWMISMTVLISLFLLTKPVYSFFWSG